MQPNRRIRVVHLVTTMNIGGLEMVVLDLVRHRGPDIDPFVMCLEETGALAPRLAEAGVDVESIDARAHGVLPRIVGLARRLRQLRPDVLHTHNRGPHRHGAVAGKIARVPVLVHTKHGRNEPGRLSSVLQNRFASLVTDCVVPVSHDAAHVAIAVERIPAGKIRVIHNGVDLARFAFRTGKPNERGIRAITVARLDPVKDQATMLRAVRTVVESEPGFHLDVVGDGECRAELEAVVRDLDLSTHVTLHGFRDDVAQCLAAADYFLLSSLSEGISLTLLEAMAVGLPAVATDVGGNREVVIDGLNGYLVPAGSPDEFSRAMIRMQADRARMLSMGYAARRRIEQEFSLSRMVDAYEATYRQLVENLQPSARPRTW
jgi:sugar transferase (PEP-CTERM/EpsH1 system associated)